MQCAPFHVTSSGIWDSTSPNVPGINSPQTNWDNIAELWSRDWYQRNKSLSPRAELSEQFIPAFSPPFKHQVQLSNSRTKSYNILGASQTGKIQPGRMEFTDDTSLGECCKYHREQRKNAKGTYLSWAGRKKERWEWVIHLGKKNPKGMCRMHSMKEKKRKEQARDACLLAEVYSIQ